MLTECGLHNVLPDCPDIAIGVGIYHSFANYENDAWRHGVVAFDIEVLPHGVFADCGKPLAGPCSCAGGCFQHRNWWEFQSNMRPDGSSDRPWGEPIINENLAEADKGAKESDDSSSDTDSTSSDLSMEFLGARLDCNITIQLCIYVYSHFR